MGLKFYDYDGLQPKISPPKHFSPQCMSVHKIQYFGILIFSQKPLYLSLENSTTHITILYIEGLEYLLNPSFADWNRGLPHLHKLHYDICISFCILSNT